MHSYVLRPWLPTPTVMHRNIYSCIGAAPLLDTSKTYSGTLWIKAQPQLDALVVMLTDCVSVNQRFAGICRSLGMAQSAAYAWQIIHVTPHVIFVGCCFSVIGILVTIQAAAIQNRPSMVHTYAAHCVSGSHCYPCRQRRLAVAERFAGRLRLQGGDRHLHCSIVAASRSLVHWASKIHAILQPARHGHQFCSPHGLCFWRSVTRRSGN